MPERVPFPHGGLRHLFVEVLPAVHPFTLAEGVSVRCDVIDRPGALLVGAPANAANAAMQSPCFHPHGLHGLPFLVHCRRRTSALRSHPPGHAPRPSWNLVVFFPHGDVELPFVVRQPKDEVSLRVGNLVGLLVVTLGVLWVRGQGGREGAVT